MKHEDPTKDGLQIRLDPHIKFADVFDYALQHYRAKCEAESTGDNNEDTKLEGIEDFLTFTRELFSKNQAIAQDFMNSSLGLRFQDGTSMPFCAVVNEGMTSETGHMPMTRPQKKLNEQQKGATVPTHSWGVTSEQT